MPEKILFQGAEAVISLNDNQITKNRIKKGYRIKELDEKLRFKRTKSEAKIINKLQNIISIPKIIQTDKENIIMEYIKGKKLSDSLNNIENKNEIAEQIGHEIAKIHDLNIIHGDLTTSNMIYVEDEKDNKPYSLLGMNNFKKQLIELKRLNLPKNKFAVFGGSLLALYGIRDTKDIDIIVKEDLWNELIKKYSLKKENLIKIGSIEIYKDWKPWFKDANELIDDAEIFESIRFVKLKHVLDWKKAFNREKDKIDIKSIEKHNSSNNFKIYFIDFGLGFHSSKIEDKAVDLHLIKQALEAKHFNHWKSLFEYITKGYNSKDKDKILKQLEKVEARGRYKEKH